MGDEDKRSYWVKFVLYIIALSVGAASLGLFALAEVRPDQVSLAGVGILISLGLICASVAGLRSIKRN